MSRPEQAEKARGIILFAHGSRDPQWRETFTRLERMIAGQAKGAAVRAAFLRDLEPGIFSVADDMAAGGCERITIIPMFLAAGAHSARDFPEIAGELERKHGGVVFEWTDVIGRWDETINALAGVIAARIGCVRAESG